MIITKFIITVKKFMKTGMKIILIKSKIQVIYYKKRFK